MKLSIIQVNNQEVVVLLDEKMRIVTPVYNYLKYLRQMNRSINTVRACGRDLKAYWEFLELKGYTYEKATPNIIGEFIEFLREPIHDESVIFVNAPSKRTGKTINRILSTIHNFYKYCTLIIQIQNPIYMDDVNRPFDMFKSLLHHAKKDNKIKKSIFKVKENERAVRILSDTDAKIFSDNLHTRRDKIIFKILYLTGMRIGEVLSLGIEDIPIPDSSKEIAIITLMPKDTNRYDQQNKSGSRKIYMPMSLLEEIDNYIMNERNNIDTEHSYLFVSYEKQFKGKPLTYRGLYEVFKRVCSKTGISINFHDLRHTYITNLIESGIDISVVRIIAGHKHISTTQKYTHLSSKYLDDALQRYWSKSELIGGVYNE
ncbi:hypothetical protein NZ45_14100 [Clostridium botulinum]|uniref:Tyrosine-type recombinase/integrase n=1 Tax=Clostridium botulinum TaxID=1491 RepID=A0ABD7CKJ2_CLOBO|nr:tyrosine-type recombinase/integrase [Clostridium botulinum]KGO13103.1 hypothetical protein NZ45_14100 [Clostridium botulinum]QRI53950.1 tyrosine-type recombinase/integrase [Clostridium botulinum]